MIFDPEDGDERVECPTCGQPAWKSVVESADKDLLDRAVQALEEREAAWAEPDEPEVPSGGPDD